MKKNFIPLASVFIITVFIFMISFIVNTRRKTSNYGNSIEFEFNGEFQIYQYGDKPIDNEFLLFNKNKVTISKESQSKEYIFEYKNNILSITELGSYTVKILSTNNIYLIQPDTKEFKLVRVGEKIDKKKIQGAWNLLSVASEQKLGEKIFFTIDESTSTFSDYRNGSVYYENSFLFDERNHLFLTGLKKDFYGYIFNDYLLLIDENNMLWELKFEGVDNV